MAYPAAGTPNADVSLLLIGLDGRRLEVDTGGAAFPYLVTAAWQAGGDPLIVVQSRDQRVLRLLAADPATGATTVLREDTDPRWVDIVPGVPARTGDGRIAWAADSGGARRLLVGTPDEVGDGAGAAVTPPSLQVREVLSVDAGTVLFTASAGDPTAIGLWLYRPDRPDRRQSPDSRQSPDAPERPDGRGTDEISPPGGVHPGPAGGTTVMVSRTMTQPGPSVHVLKDTPAHPAITETTRIAVLDETPNVPAPHPDLFAAGAREIRSALLLPSWHEPGSGTLPVLLDPYGGPHAQRVLAAPGAYLTSQWFAEQGFAVLVADGRGHPGPGPGVGPGGLGDIWPGRCSRTRSRRCRRPPHATPIWIPAGSRSAAGRSAATWPRWPCCAARTCSTRRSRAPRSPTSGCMTLITPSATSACRTSSRQVYEQSSLLADAHRLSRPVLFIHGLADDNVVAAHTLRMSSALLAAGRPHRVLPLSGVTHMTPQEEVAENLLLLQVDFLRETLEMGRTVSTTSTT